MSLSDFLYSLEPRQALAIALGLSVALYALGANVSWTYRITRPGRLGRFAEWVQSAWGPRIAGEVVRWLYYLALPWGTLMLGYNSVRALGIWSLDWVGSAFDLPILGIGAALVFIWIWRPYARAEQPHANDSTGWNWARHIVEVLYQEAHWAFYRSGPILWIGGTYWASFFGLALVFVEGWSNPAVRTDVLDVSRADAPLWSGSIAVVSTVVFIFTQNSWYALSVHLLLDLGLRGLIGFPRVHAPGEVPPAD